MKFAAFIIGFALVASVEALAAGPVPFEIVDKRVEERIRDYDEYRIKDQDGKVRTLARDEVPPEIVQHFTLRNTSQKVIDAWSFSCLHALSDGHFSLGGRTSDAYLRRERQGALGAVPDGLIYPGDTIEITAKRRPGAGKYYAEQCRVDAVVFTDATWAGEEEAARAFFDQRLRHALDARDALGWAEELLQANGTSKAALARSAEAWLQRLEERQSSYASPVRQSLEWKRSSADPGDQDLLPLFTGYMKAMQQELEQILGRLPEEWQAAFHDKEEDPR